MKLVYLLQTVRGVPLGYDFSLYAYGPFDADVLDDLDYAQTLGAVTVTLRPYPRGYGYEIQPGDDHEKITARAAQFLADHQQDLEWAIQEFGGFSAADLELLSTMVYVDREAGRAGELLSLTDLTRRVLAVKPRFTESYARERAAELQDKGLFSSANGEV